MDGPAVRHRVWRELKWVGRIMGETLQSFEAANRTVPEPHPLQWSGEKPNTVGTPDINRQNRAPGREPRA